MVRKALVAVVACSLLAACGHSRVVRRDYDSPPPSSSSSTRSRPAVSRAAPSPIPSGAVHVVRAGETLYGISFRFGLRYQDVAEWNGIGEPYTIEVGQRLRLRPPGSMPSPRRGAPVAASGAPPRPHPLLPNATRPSNPSPGAAPATGPSAVPASPVRPNAPMVGAPSWRWPAQGQIIGRYVSGDQTQQGINIAGSAGQPILAAADGIVVYSGAGLVGYGELIIIKHSDEWLSAYAHNRRRLVIEGSRVKSGEVIAEMGKTGAIREMLHFEIRRNGKPVDPLVFLPKP
jgi:lipoprotein NlpD